MNKLALLLAVSSLVTSLGCVAESAEDASDGAAAFTAKASKHAIVLAHGFNASTTNSGSFYKVAEALRSEGHLVHEALVAPYRSVEVRAPQLAEHVNQALIECKARPGCDASKVHIIAHSMGGLDARYLIAKLGYGDRVASLTTISTPHRGSNIADVLLDYTPDSGGGAVNALVAAWGQNMTKKELAENSDLSDALIALSEKHASESFNPSVKDDPRVTYLSWAGVSDVPFFTNAKDAIACEGTLSGPSDSMALTLAASAPIVGHYTDRRPNDGMVMVESAKWGTFKGCIPADHLDEVGQPKHDKPDSKTGFDHLAFYKNIAASLDDEVAASTRTASTH